MNPERCCTLDNFYKALADETRQSILVLLKNGELSAGELTAHFTLSQPAISHHLAILRRVHLAY